MKLEAIEIHENVKQLSDTVLLYQTTELAQRSRQVTILILQHLREIEIRRLFVELGFCSMYEYCIKILKFSEGETQRRLSSARLLTAMPEIEEKIQQGSLTITSLSKIQSFLNSEKKANRELTKNEKLELVQQLENKSTRTVERELIEQSSQPLLLAQKFHCDMPVANVDIQYQNFTAPLDSADQELLQEFRNLYAHELQDMGDLYVLRFLLEKVVTVKKKKLGIDKLDSSNATPPSSPTVNQTEAQTADSPPKKQLGDIKESFDTANQSPHQSKASEGRKSKTPPRARSALSISVKRQIWRRAEGRCEHIDKTTNHRCSSKFALEEDHIQPIALGGTNEVDNLQLLCRSHNSRRSVRTFGRKEYN